ncbi:flagellin [Priestia megaterium]|uniref:flagellin N-terminal helical domain-containing protein n=1 Tax=Priestia megaterium TaxID=1404 RepID=UPI00070EAC90|nr:flagellin [Priestia megaterium]KRE10439.1 flagellin [Bacillus sp. Root239]PGK31169.1 flagellin [Priestia megaterium]
MRINHNITALNTYRQFNNANNAQSKSMEKLSSGLRINSAADDAAGLAISEKMRGQIRGLDQAGKNAQDSISMIQTAEGALNETNDILQRMRELGVQAGNDTNTTEDRGEIQKEINQLTSEVNRIGNTTEFNTQKLLNASSGSQVGGTPAVPGTAATTIASATDMSATAGNTATGEVKVSGTFTGTADETLTFEKTATGWSIDGGNSDVTLTGNTFTYKGMTIDASAAVVAGDAATGDSWTQDLTAAVAGTPASGGKSQFTAQIGANENQTITLEFEDMRAAALGITGTAGTTGFTSGDTVTDGSNNAPSEAALDVSSAANAGNAVTVIQSAIDKVSAERSKLGAYQNRLDHTINNLSTSSENLTAAESRIRDVDYALAA